MKLDLSGWSRLAELTRAQPTTGRAFVALWFDAQMEEACRDGIEAALLETGYRPPFRVDEVEHNGKICDAIVAEIRRCDLVVADFTGDRGGVYFEAGFALGLGRQVIWTCRKDWVEHLHFDTRQYNYIVWERPDELRRQLRQRIEATIPNRPRR